MQPAISVFEWADKLLPGVPVEDLAYVHLLYSHRQQRHMLMTMLKHVEAKKAAGAADLKEMLGMWETLYAAHSGMEEEVLFPQLIAATEGDLKRQMTEAVNALHEQHNSLDAAQNAMKAAVAATAENPEQARLAIKDFARAYHNHSVEEEERLLPLAHKIPKDKMMEIAKAAGAFFRAQPSVGYCLRVMQDLATIHPRDATIWNARLPWFVRNVVVGFLSLGADYKKYTALFPIPTELFDREFTQTLA